MVWDVGAACSRSAPSSSANHCVRQEILYDLKRRLRAGRKRPVLAADYRGTR